MTGARALDKPHGSAHLQYRDRATKPEKADATAVGQDVDERRREDRGGRSDTFPAGRPRLRRARKVVGRHSAREQHEKGRTPLHHSKIRTVVPARLL